MNLSPVRDWSREWAFVDVFKHSRAWTSQNPGTSTPWSNQQPIELNAEGWPILKPGQAVGTLMCREMEGHYPAGTYICTFEGEGVLAFGLDAKIVGGAANRLEVKVTPGNGGIYLRIDRSNPQNPVRNIHVWMPGFEGARSSFHPLFVERLRPFKVIRFMDWAATNDSPLAHWADRTTPNSPRQSGPHGVALEYMIELCNELEADPWFCMPHLADDEFTRNFAILVRQQLKPDLKIYVEWSNEAWNTLFAQCRWVKEQAGERGVKPEEVTADEALRSWRIWREVFGDESPRIIRVAAGQLYNVSVAERILNRLKGEFDVLSCSAYGHIFRKDTKDFTEQTIADEILAVLRKTVIEQDLPMVARYSDLAQKWSTKLGRHIPLVAYEGGQALTVQGNRAAPYAKAYHQAQTAPEMADIYRILLDGFAQHRGELFLAYSYVTRQDQWGSWGHLQYQDEPESAAPKFGVLAEWTRAAN